VEHHHSPIADGPRPVGDTDSDGDCDQTDIDNIDNWTSGYDVRYDADLNGLIEAADSTRASTFFQGTTMGWGVLSNPDVGNRKDYAGYEWDEAVSKYHIRHRVFDPALGRWLRRDPLDYLGAMNTYEYVASQPLIAFDPTGLIQWVPFTPQIYDRNLCGPIIIGWVRTDPPNNSIIQVWRSVNPVYQNIMGFGNPVQIPSDQDYWCHGFTFDGVSQRPPLSPFGSAVTMILNDEWECVCCTLATKGDIIIYYNANFGIMHSGKITQKVNKIGKDAAQQFDAIRSLNRSKWDCNGILAVRKVETDRANWGAFKYTCYRKRNPALPPNPLPCKTPNSEPGTDEATCIFIP
jgi:RHS repeat-associated protein